MTAVGGAPLDHRLVERQMLKRVQRVVVNEDADRPLRGQQVGCVLDQVLDVVIVRQLAGAGMVLMLLGRGGCEGLFHDGCGECRSSSDTVTASRAFGKGNVLGRAIRSRGEAL